LEEFELNRMNVYVLYDVIPMFVNDVACDQDMISSGKDILVSRLIRMCIVCEFV